MIKETREKFLKFFKEKEHKIVDSFSIIPENDATLLFINSGMAPLKRFFLEEGSAPFERMSNSQRCLRVGGKHNDLSEVGYTKRHHTFFEMLGNFSFGNYFQEDAINYAWEFLNEVLKLDKSRLYVTVHPKDEDAFNIWANLIEKERIFKLEENVWSIGEIGPFGYCSEIFYDLENTDNKIDITNDNRFLEIWNLVFMKFYKDGKVESLLPKPCIDAGMGLERIVSVLENVNDTYNISFFKNALNFLNLKEQSIDSKIFLDHLRSAAFMISEGVIPGPSGKEYVLRRLIRRGLKSFFTFKNLNFKEVVNNIINLWQKDYDFEFKKEEISKILNQEKEQFQKILEHGLTKFEELYSENKNLNPEQLFMLHDTYGFSIDIVVDLLKARNVKCDLSDFEKIMEEHKEKNRKKSLNIVLPYEDTIFLDEYEIEAEIIGFYEDYVILNKTPFYAEGGGQVGDQGYIQGVDFKLRIVDTKKINKVIIHKFETEEGKAKEGKVTAKIDKEDRKQTTAHHSSTHLLNAVLCQMFGDKIKQMGSYVCKDKLRLDFSYQETISSEDLIKIESTMNKWIQENHEVKIESMKLEEAVQAGAIAHFTYEDKVRTIKMGNRSFELCGGTHVKFLGDIGLFKIIKASSTSAGVKRIEGCCAQSAIEKMQKNSLMLKEIANFLKTEEDQILQKLNNMSKKNNQVVNIEQKVINGIKVGFCIGNDVDLEKEMAKNKIHILLVASENDEKIGLQLKIENINKDLEGQNLDAKKIMQEIGLLIGAKGCGGKKNYAQTGGKAIQNKELLFEKLIEILEKN